MNTMSDEPTDRQMDEHINSSLAAAKILYFIKPTANKVSVSFRSRVSRLSIIREQADIFPSVIALLTNNSAQITFLTASYKCGLANSPTTRPKHVRKPHKGSRTALEPLMK